MQEKTKPIVGRAALIDFPELGLAMIPSKTDSGAYRSAVHALNIRLVERDGHKVLEFDLLKGHPCAGQSVHVETKDFKEAEVENSFAVREKRYVVDLLTVLDGKRFRTAFTLADRSKKTYPVLMGRRMLNKRFLVDTNLSQIDRRLLKKKFRINLPLDLEETDP